MKVRIKHSKVNLDHEMELGLDDLASNRAFYNAMMRNNLYIPLILLGEETLTRLRKDCMAKWEREEGKIQSATAVARAFQSFKSRIPLRWIVASRNARKRK